LNAERSLAERVLGFACALPLALIVVLTFADVFARYLFASPIRGSVEIIEFAMALVIFTALPLVTRRRGHITVSLVDGLLKGRAGHVKRVLCDLLSATALGVLTWRLWLQAGSDVRASTQTIVLGLPTAPLTYALAAFALLSLGAMLWLLWRNLQGDAQAAGGQLA
jgi:TRAP-type transport system small permease protein